MSGQYACRRSSFAESTGTSGEMSSSDLRLSGSVALVQTGGKAADPKGGGSALPN